MTGPGGAFRSYCSYLPARSCSAWSNSGPESMTRALPSILTRRRLPRRRRRRNGRPTSRPRERANVVEPSPCNGRFRFGVDRRVEHLVAQHGSTARHEDGRRAALARRPTRACSTRALIVVMSMPEASISPAAAAYTSSRARPQKEGPLRSLLDPRRQRYRTPRATAARQSRNGEWLVDNGDLGERSGGWIPGRRAGTLGVVWMTSPTPGFGASR